MYDAKKIDKNEKNDLKLNSICDKSYFSNGLETNVLRTKSSYVPSECLLNNEIF